MIIKKTLVGSLAFAAVIASSLATAATQGLIGSISEGSLDVSITKGAAVKVSKLDDVTFDASNFMLADALKTEDFCVFSSSGLYGITVTSANPTAATTFGMTSSSTSDLLAYEVTVGGSVVESGQTLSGQVGDQLNQDCVATVNALMLLKVAANDFNAVAPGIYGDTLNISVRPE